MLLRAPYLVATGIFLSTLITDTDATPPEKPIIVTAKRPEFSRPPSSAKITTYSQEKIKKNQYDQLTEVINATPGYMVVQSGGPGQQSSIYVRGTNANHVQVRQDGMKLNPPQTPNGAFDAAILTTQDLSTVALLRGSQGSLYGSDAIGGAILLTTPQGEGPIAGTVRLEGGSQKTANGAAHLSGQLSATRLYVGISGYRTGGIRQTPPNYRVPGGSYPRLPYRQGSYAVRLDHTFNDMIDLSLISRLSAGHLSYQHLHPPATAVPQHRQQILQRAILTVKPTSFWSHQIGFGSLSDDQIDARHHPSFSKNQGRRYQLDWTQTLDFEALGAISVIVESVKDHARKRDRQQSTSHRQDSTGIGVSWEKKWQWIGLDASVRRDKISGFPEKVTHREGITITPFASTKLIASHGTSFKAPSLFQLYTETPFFKGNPHLKPEQAHQGEVGFEQKICDQFLWEETYFINHIRDLIESTPDWKSVINVGRARTSGLESVLTWIGYKGWSGDVNYTYTKTRNLVLNKPLRRRPRNKLSGRIYYKTDTWLWTAEVLWVGNRRDTDLLMDKEMHAKSYVVTNIKVQKNFSDSFNIFGRVDNLFNKKIQDPIGYRKAGISVFVGLETTIGS
jgi:vitamin B12 transporter